ncbi:glycosyltransferase family 4 protein [Melittangium boletus]|uniref:Glycosyl transferase n=1 Tax=Melittangium boletus DSM 14713 TaxID=1294270 RepID=A0A250I841_9BACT|nr:glycosyltransferase family 4 protein [Melittangium boletus]ATB27332.1 glycosyl transferase [Melittangium boletus DSM 14713]
MRIAQVSPLIESVPPRRYGGTERVVAYLTEELIEQGHDVTLFASGDSLTRARLVSPCARALRAGSGFHDPLPHLTLMLEQVLSEAYRFDVIHFHTECVHFPLSRRLRLPQLTTLHGRLDLPGLKGLYREFRDMPLVSISDDQREPLSWAHWLGTVHHGLPEALYPFHPEPGKYLAFLGRISPEKGVVQAIHIAEALGLPLRIAAKLGTPDRAYFEAEVEPLLRRGPGAEFIGEIGEDEKADFLGQAMALLFPIDWPEPFGLVMIEALACGTPVIAFRRGAVPEILKHGLTGFIVDDLDGAIRAGARLSCLDRYQCRLEFERRFSARRMAQDYVMLYQELLSHERPVEWGVAP